MVFLCWQLASLALAASDSCNSTHAQQCDAVRRLYVSLKLNYTGTHAWIMTADCCTYRGISCDSQNVNVTGLDFFGQNGNVAAADASVLCHVASIGLHCGFQFDAAIADFGGTFSSIGLINAVEWPRGMILDGVYMSDNFRHAWQNFVGHDPIANTFADCVPDPGVRKVSNNVTENICSLEAWNIYWLGVRNTVLPACAHNIQANYFEFNETDAVAVYPQLLGMQELRFLSFGFCPLTRVDFDELAVGFPSLVSFNLYGLSGSTLNVTGRMSKIVEALTIIGTEIVNEQNLWHAINDTNILFLTLLELNLTSVADDLVLRNLTVLDVRANLLTRLPRALLSDPDLQLVLASQNRLVQLVANDTELPNRSESTLVSQFLLDDNQLTAVPQWVVQNSVRASFANNLITALSENATTAPGVTVRQLDMSNNRLLSVKFYRSQYFRVPGGFRASESSFTLESLILDGNANLTKIDCNVCLQVGVSAVGTPLQLDDMAYEFLFRDPSRSFDGGYTCKTAFYYNRYIALTPTQSGQLISYLDPSPWLVDPSAFNYASCQCDDDYFGAPPHCTSCIGQRHTTCNASSVSSQVGFFLETINSSWADLLASPCACFSGHGESCLDSPCNGTTIEVQNASSFAYSPACLPGYEQRLCSRCACNSTVCYYQTDDKCTLCEQEDSGWPIIVASVLVGLIVLLFCLSDDWRPQAVLAVAVAILTVLELTSKLWALAAVFLTELTHYFHHSCVLWSGEGAHKDDREQPRQPAVVPAGEPVDNVAEDDDLRELELVPLVVRQPVAGGRQPDSEMRLASTTGVFKQLIWFVQATAALNAGLWPHQLRDAQEWLQRLVNVRIASGVECLLPPGWLTPTRLLLSEMAVPLVLALFVTILLVLKMQTFDCRRLVRSWLSGPAGRDSAVLQRPPPRLLIVSCVLFVLNLIYFELTSAIVERFACTPAGASFLGSFMAKHPWISCAGTEFHELSAIAGAFFVLYSVGWPALLLTLIWRRRATLDFDANALQMLGFFYRDYRPIARVWAELFFLSRRVLMALTLAIVPDDDALRLGIVSALLVVYGISSFGMKLRLHAAEEWLDAIVSTSLLITASVFLPANASPQLRASFATANPIVYWLTLALQACALSVILAMLAFAALSAKRHQKLLALMQRVRR